MKTKVLFAIHTLGIGGAEKVLINLVNNMSSKYDITVMTIINTGAFRKSLNENITYKTMFNLPSFLSKENYDDQAGSLLNNDTNIFKKIFVFFYQLMWKCMPTKLLHKWKIKDTYDIEISFLEGITAKVVSGCTNKKTKKIAWLHVDLINEKKSQKVFFTRNLEKKCYEKFDKVVCVSQVVKNQFIKKFNYDKDKVLVIYNAIDTENIMDLSNKEIVEKFDNNVLNLVSIGRLSPQKGYDRLLWAIEKLATKNINFHLYIIGIGPEKEQLNQLLSEYNIKHLVTFLGYKSNPYPYLKKSDLFVCSSRAEGFSTAVSEATVLDIPTVTTDCSGMNELFGNSEYGLIVENTKEALYNGLVKIMQNPLLISKYKSSLKNIKGRFNITNTIQDVEDLIDETIG